MHSAHAHERLRLPRWIRWWVYGGGCACAATGIAWLLLHDFVTHEGAFGPESHPLEHPMLVAHGCAGLAMLWVFGLVWLPHVRRGWSRRRHRVVGGMMAALMLSLCASAAMLYYLGDERWRSLVAVAHWGLGLFAVAWLPLHIWLGRQAIRKSASRAGEGRRTRSA